MNLHHNALREKGEREKAKLIMKQAVKWLDAESNMSKWIHEACKGLQALIKLHILDGELIVAKHYLEIIEALVEEHDSTLAKFELAAARIQMNYGPEESKSIDEDLDTLKVMIECADSSGSPYELAVCLEWEYLLKASRDGVTAETIEKGRKAYGKYESLGLTPDFAFGFNNIAYDWIELNEFAKAKKLLKKAEQMSDDFCLMNLKPFIELNLGKIAARSSDRDSAKAHFDKAIKMVAVYCGKEDLQRFTKDRTLELSK